MLTPYVPGEQPKLDNLVKLNTNENPYGPSPQVIAAISDAAGDSLRLYPDPNSDKLKAAIAANFGTAPAQVFVGNGSDEVLAFVFLALLKHGKSILFPDITYSFYPVYCSLFEIAYETVALNEKFEIDVADFLSNDILDCGGIIFPNPNAPTGCLLGLDAIEKLLKAKPDTVIVVDEAYVDFGGETAIPLVAKYPNLLVVQTLSKSRSLAGLRVGFAVGHADLVEALERVKNSFNSYPLDRLAQAAAVAAMEDRDYFETTCKAVIDTRASMVNGLKELGFEVLPSAANFVFTRHSREDAAALAAKLRQHSIIVRHFKLPRIDQFLRISVGTNEQCDSLIAALKEILA